MQYKNETGIILNHLKDIVHITTGTPGMVEFPNDVIWDLHKKQPGYIYCLAHTHPPGMPHLSGEDMTTLQGWARAVYPFPMRMSVTSEELDHTFITNVYIGIWESRAAWLSNGKKPEGREVKVFLEKWKRFTFPQDYYPEGLTQREVYDYLKKERYKPKLNTWENVILRASYAL